jgi:DMSO/TMAO reductase YedYZ molybdopterin-dependent catalytic subunit
MQRRDFLKMSLAASAVAVSSSAAAGVTTQPIDNRKVSRIAFPEKKPLITYSDRPPLLETPREVFSKAITPNDEFFVRWHLPEIPTYIDTETYTLNINGLVNQEISLTLKDLKENFEQVEVTAVLQCGGNSRSAFKPQAGGIQWGSGAMGCAAWKGVRLRDILNRAGLQKEAHWIGFNGKDNAAYYESPSFIRELEISELDDHVIVAYEMNGEDLPYLNGFPLRLVIPGYYSDSWVKMLSNVTVTKEYKNLFFMDVAYRVPDNACECEDPNDKAKVTKPITHMNVKSVIGYPTNETIVHHNSHVVVRGVAWDDGHGIKNVFISTDEGKTWQASVLDEDAGRYAYKAFRFSFKPTKYGKTTVMAKAVNRLGQEQPLAKDIQWNHGGYKYNGIDTVTFEVV